VQGWRHRQRLGKVTGSNSPIRGKTAWTQQAEREQRARDESRLHKTRHDMR
jgi:hypothetical protein